VISKQAFEDAAAELSRLYRKHQREAQHQLKNTWHFIVAQGKFRVVPLARVIIGASPSKGDMLAKNVSGRVGNQQRKALAAAGYSQVKDGDVGFEDLWTAYLSDLSSVGVDTPSNGTPSPRAVRSFHVLARAPLVATTVADILDAMSHFQSGKRPENMGTPSGWHIRHPSTGEPIPLKAIWALANGLTNAEFNNSAALRRSIEKLGFICVDLRQTADMSTVYANIYPDEVSRTYPEGAQSPTIVNRYERSKAARQDCILHYRNLRGATLCEACGFNFEACYGELGAGFIHVHHIVKQADIGAGYQVNPRVDLVPLCPNCHAMAHRGKEVLTLVQLKAIIRQNKS
jgi:5-methylcytosine-specific restriction enzyme A